MVVVIMKHLIVNYDVDDGDSGQKCNLFNFVLIGKRQTNIKCRLLDLYPDRAGKRQA